MFVWPLKSLKYHVYFHFLVSAEFQIIQDDGNVSCAKILEWKDIQSDVMAFSLI